MSTVQVAAQVSTDELLEAVGQLSQSDWEHEGPDDPAGDAELLKEALTMIEQYTKNPAGWKTLEEFEAELVEATHLFAVNSRQ